MTHKYNHGDLVELNSGARVFVEPRNVPAVPAPMHVPGQGYQPIKPAHPSYNAYFVANLNGPDFMVNERDIKSLVKAAGPPVALGFKIIENNDSVVAVEIYDNHSNQICSSRGYHNSTMMTDLDPFQRSVTLFHALKLLIAAQPNHD